MGLDAREEIRCFWDLFCYDGTVFVIFCGVSDVDSVCCVCVRNQATVCM